ncbi:E3 ubiquitin-protein ligase TRIM33-like [Ptychodera flava]|uniref:E3 ubiquitin-protein ligase TRIM33-like n=1 Tax=Ptychodera flava TaxID=63121 RepID=UPI00396A40A4
MATADMPDKIEDEFLSCPVCHDRFSDPRVLDCLHSFCSPCLAKYLEVSKKKEYVREAPTCPVCHEPFVLPASGVEGLKGNPFLAGICDTLRVYHESLQSKSEIPCSGCDKNIANLSLSYCLQCGEFLCAGCVKYHRRMKATKEHQCIERKDFKDIKSWATSRSQVITLCQKHKDEPMKLYCKECDVPACVLCSIQGHKGHSFIDVAHAREKCRNAIIAPLNDAEERVSMIQYYIDEASRVKQNLEENKKKTLTDIDARADQLIKSLTKQVRGHAEKLKRETNERYTRKDEVVTEYKDKLEVDLRRASDACDYSRKVLGYGNSEEIIEMKQKLVKKLQVICASKVEELNTTGGIQLTKAESQPIIQSSHIGRVIWNMGESEFPKTVNVGDRVEPSMGWILDNQGTGVNRKGTVTSKLDGGLRVKVKWDDDKKEGIYRFGYNGFYDIDLADEKCGDKKFTLKQGWMSWMIGRKET